MSPKDIILDGLFLKVECCHVGLNQHPGSIFVAKILVIDYRHQDDETVASRGSISMKMAVLRDTERTRFEIHSIPSRTHHQHSGSQKWFMKANHPVEAHRWTQAIAKSIEWYKMRDGAESDTSSIVAGGSLRRIKSTRRKSAESDSSMMRSPSMHSQSLSGFWKKNSPGNGSTMRDPDSDLDMDASPDLSRDAGSPEQNIADKVCNEEEDEDDTSSAANSERKSPPHPNIDLQANATAAQLELTVQMVANMSSSSSTTTVPSHFRETVSALLDSLQTSQTLLSEYTSMGQSRDSWYARQLRKERARQDVWEESLRVVVKEGENLEQELRKRSRNRGSRVFSVGSPAGTITGDGKKRRPSALGFITAQERVAEELPSPIPEGEPPASAITPTVSSSPITLQEYPTSAPAAPRIPLAPHATDDYFVGPIPAITIDGDYDNSLAKAVDEGDYDHDTDEEDEFYDAIEANALPNMLVYEALASKSPEATGSIGFANQQEQSLISMKANQKFYAGYAHMRTSLKLSAERPNASLWSVLKHSIGKDLTKISFPVFFNEPTSMLQRMVRFFFVCYSGLAF
jgi:oxysterol-binding protein 1